MSWSTTFRRTSLVLATVSLVSVSACKKSRPANDGTLGQNTSGTIHTAGNGGTSAQNSAEKNGVATYDATEGTAAQNAVGNGGTAGTSPTNVAGADHAAGVNGAATSGNANVKSSNGATTVAGTSNGAGTNGAPGNANGVNRGIASVGPNGVTSANGANGATAGAAGTNGAATAGAANGSLGANALNGLNGVNGSPDLKAAAIPEAPKPVCFTETYHHKNLAGHNSDEACSHHRNIIKLGHDVNLTTLCVRVNGTPVKFERVKGHHEQVMIGHIAGPNSKIVASYCNGKNKCDEECKIPKDEFMDAIGGSEEENAVVGHWDAEDAGDSALNDKLKKELADLDETAPTVSSTIFKDWIVENDIPACGTKTQAAADAKTGTEVAAH